MGGTYLLQHHTGDLTIEWSLFYGFWFSWGDIPGRENPFVKARKPRWDNEFSGYIPLLLKQSIVTSFFHNTRIFPWNQHCEIHSHQNFIFVDNHNIQEQKLPVWKFESKTQDVSDDTSHRTLWLLKVIVTYFFITKKIICCQFSDFRITFQKNRTTMHRRSMGKCMASLTKILLGAL